MKVSVYSRMAVGALMKNGFPDNVSVVSFYNSSGMSDSGKNRVDYTKACDSVFYVCAPDIDENGFDEYGYTEDTFLSEADDWHSLQEKFQEIRVLKPLQKWLP